MPEARTMTVRPSIGLLVSTLLACSDANRNDSGPSADSDGTVAQCTDDPQVLNLSWPLAGDDAVDWVVTNYHDLEPDTGIRDYTGNSGDLAKTYDGHDGTDIGISSFRRMDEGIPVLAAVGGTVEWVVEDFEDRHTSCIDYDANVVSVRHASGHLLHYVHLRRDSVPVEVGDRIEAGTVLGEVGSSGCSDGPHLHLGIVGPDDEPIDPFRDDLWCDPPAYDTPLSWMEGWLLGGPAEQYENPVQDPPDETTVVTSGDELLVYAVAGGGLPGEEIAVRLEGPEGVSIGPWPVIFEKSYRLTIWNWAFSMEKTSGEWTAVWLVNGVPSATRRFEVSTGN